MPDPKLLEEFLSTTQKMRRLMFKFFSMSTEEKMATGLQIQALKGISENSGITVGLLAEELMMSSGAIAQLVERLIASNWVIKQIDLQDKRIAHLVLTHEGEEYLLEMKKKFAGKIGAVLALLPEEDLKEMLRIQKKLLLTLEEKNK